MPYIRQASGSSRPGGPPSHMIHHLLDRARRYFLCTEPPLLPGLHSLVAAHQQYILESLNDYRHDFEQFALDGLSPDLYGNFWKLFFNDVVAHANELDIRYSDSLQLGDALRRRLQEATEQGLSDFHELCGTFTDGDSQGH